ncbi:glycosyltransferase [Patescibacteria group bacterium]|nr:MAG: glycosyltransferase [Patescibacteria group bacterium]
MRLLIITQKVDREDSVLGFFHYWISHLAEHFDTIKIIALSVGASDLPDNVELFSLGKEKNAPKLLQAFRFYWYLFRILPKVDGVFAHMAPEYVRALYPLNVFFRRPVIMWYAHLKVSPTARWAIKHADFVLSPSKDSFEFDSPKVIATGHGIDTEQFSPGLSAPTSSSIMTISRISKEKRIEVAIRAMKILVKDRKRTDVRLHIFGTPLRRDDMEYEKILRALVVANHLREFITWEGPVANKDAPTVYRSHQIFIRMQGGGGFGKTELEAMSTGIPAITPTPVYKNDLGKFADDLFFPEDDARGLAYCITRVLSWGSARRAEYSKLSREIVKNKHDVRHVASEIARLLEKARR